MWVNEKIISKYFVKPSSPTPSSFRNHKLNFMDQVSPMMYMPYVFFYQNDESKPIQQVEKSQLLKQSLSQILNIYHPLAGRIKDNLSVDCNDTGVGFVEARVHACIAQYIEDPKMEELKHLIPVDCLFHSNDDVILSVKANFFDCGGIALGVCLSHKVADFSSFALFMNAWAAKCRGATTQIIQPSFDLALHFPPKDSIPSSFAPNEEKIMTNRLVFDEKMLERLKQQAALGEVKNPTTLEALSIFISRNSIENTKANNSSLVIYAVNLRPRTIPPISNYAFGNCSILGFASSSKLEDNNNALSKLRASIRAIDDGYIKNLTADKYLTKLNEINELLNSSTNSCSFSSYSRFPMYEVDFGWDKPVWGSLISMPYKNTVYLTTTPSQNGIEAWINMSQELFQILETSYNKLLIN